MPWRFELVGERPAAGGAGDELAGLITVLMVGVWGGGVKAERLDRRDFGFETGLRLKFEGLQRSSSVAIFFRFDAEDL